MNEKGKKIFSFLRERINALDVSHNDIFPFIFGQQNGSSLNESRDICSKCNGVGLIKKEESK